MILRLIEQRLDHWAMWQAKQHSTGLGYPKVSSIARLHLPRSTQRGQPSRLPVDEEAEETERWIAELGKLRPKLAEALCVQYLESGLMPQKARRLQQSYGQFKIHLDQAKYWLAGRLYQRNKVQLA